MKFKSAVTAIAVLSCIASSAFATSVIPTSGQVMVNQGSGFKEIKGPTAVRPGDIVTVALGSSAKISYSAQCQVPVASGQVVSIAKTIPCVVTGSMEPTNANAPPNVPPPVEPLVGGLTPGVVAGTLIVGGVVAGAIAVGSGSKSSSP